MAVVFCVFACFLSVSLAYANNPVELRNLDGGGYFAGTLVDDIDFSVGKDGEGGPHGGYSTTSSKCITCHSVHGAVVSDSFDMGQNMALLRSATGCAYCHTIGAPATPSGIHGTPEGRNEDLEYVWVYRATGGKADRATILDTADVSGHGLGGHTDVKASRSPNGTDEYAVTLQCSTCHVVHGSTVGAWLPTDFFDPDGLEDSATSKTGYKFLRANPSAAFRVSSDPFNVPVPNTATEATDLYQDILSDNTVEIETVNQFTLSIWCANCHDRAFNPSRVPLDDGEYSDKETFIVSNGYPGSIHADDSGEPIADGYALGIPHASPMQGSGKQIPYTEYTGSMECYSCHRAGLSPEGVADSTQLAKLSPAQQEAFTDPEKAKCARCHYGYMNYAVDEVRFDAQRSSDFPHSGIGSNALLSDFTIDGADPYKVDAITYPQDFWHTDELGNGIHSYRKNICGRCHAFKAGDSNDGSYQDDWVEFYRSIHELEHQLPGWPFNPWLHNTLHSPVFGATP